MITASKILQLAELCKLELMASEVSKFEKELNHRLENITEKQVLEAAWEMSSLSRIDGVRFQPSYEFATKYEDLVKKTRTKHFDFNTKATILLGAFVVLEENYSTLFKKAWESYSPKEIDLSELREDKVRPSLSREEMMKVAPHTNGEYFVVPQVVEE